MKSKHNQPIAPVHIDSYIINNLQPGKSYAYRLAAVNEAGTSGYSQTSDRNKAHD